MTRSQKIDLCCELFEATKKLVDRLDCEIAESNGDGIGIFPTPLCENDSRSADLETMFRRCVEQAIKRLEMAIEIPIAEDLPCRG